MHLRELFALASPVRVRSIVAVLLAGMVLLSACGSVGGETAATSDGSADTGATAGNPLGTPIDLEQQELADLPSQGPYQASFQTLCGYSHSLQDDPIVSPGVPGVSHLHDFFGNVDVDANTDYEDLLTTDTTCAIDQDKASYWTPAMFIDGSPIEPLGSLAYYRVADGVSLADVEAFPPGLMMVSGDQFATEAQDPRGVGWSCGNSPNITAEPGECPLGSSIRMRLVFPDCWNGADIRSIDNSHVARSDGDGCPDSHPVVMPALEFSVSYPPIPPGSEVRLASGSVLTAHGDFWNGWNQDRLVNEVTRCLRRNAYC